MKKSNKFSPEVRERTVNMVHEHRWGTFLRRAASECGTPINLRNQLGVSRCFH